MELSYEVFECDSANHYLLKEKTKWGGEKQIKMRINLARDLSLQLFFSPLMWIALYERRYNPPTENEDQEAGRFDPGLRTNDISIKN